MKKTLFTLLLACWVSLTFAQLNMTLLDQVDYAQDLNDIWGWVDPDDGTEYAIVGVRNGVSVVSLADPENAVEVAFLPGANSTWRDIKTWGDYAYVTNETSGGLMVIDLTDAPDNITATNWTPNLPGLGTLNTGHNIYIDEFGYAYIAGSNLNSGGMLILDVFTTPGTPIFIAAAPAIYAHDVYTRDNIMYASEIYQGRLAIYDVENKSAITLEATQQTPFNFTHNAWLNDAGDVVFTTDEKANAPIAAYDISDLDNIVELDQFKPIATLNANVIPHNVHVWEDWLIISYYTDGGIIVDASKPDNLIEVGNWDTFLGGNGGFSGAWGAYPFLPSGIVLLTDIGNGLFICGATYVRACWLEGTVTDAVTGLPIFGADIQIESSQPNMAMTDPLGEYQTGQAIAGTFDVVFSAPGYFPKTVQAVLDNGVLTILDVELDPLSSFSISGQTVRTVDSSPVAGAEVILQGDQVSYSAITDGNGNFTFPGILGGEYTLAAGAWGYKHGVIDNFTVDLNTPSPIVVNLTKGYQDDFFFDLGWTETHTASTGWWELGEPVGTTTGGQFSNPEFDIAGDLGDQCYVTGNDGGGVGDDDVDNGTVTLYSPVMDLSSYNEPVLSYNTWFFNGGGSGNPNDALEVRITNGTDEVVLETITQSAGSWNPTVEFNLASLIPLTDNMQVIFETSDMDPGHLVEAAVDAFLVEDISAYPPFTSTATTGCLPFTVNFSDQSDSTATWTWELEGGTPATSNMQNPTVVYDTPGKYDVTLTVVTNDGNTYVIDRPDFVTVNAAPTANFNYIISGADVAFDNASTGGNSFAWDFGDNTTSNQENPTHTYQETGIFTVTLSVTNDCGVQTFTQDVLILAVPPTALFEADITAGCAPLTIEFTDLSTGSPDTWAWVFPGGEPFSSNEQNPVVTYSEPGTYSVQLTTSNPAGQSTAIQSQFIEISIAPEAAFAFSTDGNEVTFVNTSTDATTYEWSFGDGITSNEANPTHTYNSNGEFEVTLTATNDCGFAVFTQTVNIEVTGTLDLDETSYTLDASPNPFSEEILVKYDLSKNFNQANLLIFNILGKQTGNMNLGGAQGSVSLNDEFPGSGVYFLRLMVDGKVGKVLRVVKI